MGTEFVTQEELNKVVNNLSNNLQATSINLQNNQMGLQEQIIGLDNLMIYKNNLTLSDIDLTKIYKTESTSIYRDGKVELAVGEVTFDVKTVNENFILGTCMTMYNSQETTLNLSTLQGSSKADQLFNLYKLNNQINLLIIDIDDDSVFRLIWNDNLKQFEGNTEEVKEGTNEVFVGWTVLK